jgi:hypothetical protein
MADALLDPAKPLPPQARLARIVTGAACAVALVLAVAPWWFTNGRYDPTIAMLMISFMGVAWYTYYQRQTLLSQGHALAMAQWRYEAEGRRAQRQREHDRHLLAARISTAVLAELPILLARLAELRETSRLPPRDHLAHPLLAEALSHVEVFDESTVQGLALTSRRLREVQQFVNTGHGYHAQWLVVQREVREREVLSTNMNETNIAREEASRLRVREDETTKLAQSFAATAHNSVVALVGALRAAGGAMPTASLPGKVDLEAMPELNPNPFEMPSS